MRGTKGGEKGGLGRAEILKSETLMGRMLRWTPEFGVSGELTLIFISSTLALPAVLPRFILFRANAFNLLKNQQKTCTL